jgi:hypothetical protein
MELEQASLFDGPAPTIRIITEGRVCRCGSAHCVLGPGTKKHAARLLCENCQRFRDWVSHEVKNYIEDVYDTFGIPDEPIRIRYDQRRYFPPANSADPPTPTT